MNLVDNIDDQSDSRCDMLLFLLPYLYASTTVKLLETCKLIR